MGMVVGFCQLLFHSSLSRNLKHLQTRFVPSIVEPQSLNGIFLRCFGIMAVLQRRCSATMTQLSELQTRANAKCELCCANDPHSVYEVSGSSPGFEKAILICATCNDQLLQPASIEESHWYCLKDSMWSPVPAVQVLAWRLLSKFKQSSWAGELLELLYLDQDLSQWAEADAALLEDSIATKDCNGSLLYGGDTVTLIKDLDVKGAGFTAKRGTAVRGISLTTNPEHIEGRVNGTRVVLLSRYLKKSV